MRDTQCNQLDSQSYSLASKGVPAGPFADQRAPKDTTHEPPAHEHSDPSIPVCSAEPSAALGELFDLIAALNESALRAKSPRGENGPAHVHELPKTTKRTARKGREHCSQTREQVMQRPVPSWSTRSSPQDGHALFAACSSIRRQHRQQ
jgi:hypothetical protein